MHARLTCMTCHAGAGYLHASIAPAWRRLASLGNVAVDVFLLITTLLATYQLLPLLEGSAAKINSSQAGAAGKPGHSHPPSTLCSVVLGYYQRRIRRVLPLYMLAQLLIVLSLLSAWAPPALSPEAAAAKALCFGLGCPTRLWANALFATHLQGRYGCGERQRHTGVQSVMLAPQGRCTEVAHASPQPLNPWQLAWGLLKIRQAPACRQ